jgi:hypothetical protein
VVCGIYAGFRLSDGSHHETVQHHHQVQLTIDGQHVAFLIDDLAFKASIADAYVCPTLCAALIWSGKLILLAFFRKRSQ